jgi:hypothetical protein
MDVELRLMATGLLRRNLPDPGAMDMTRIIETKR